MIDIDEIQPNEFKKQLHEQQAINNNANLGSIVALIVALIVVFGYFGFVLVNTIPDFSNNFACLKVIEANCTYYYLDVLLLSYLISVFVLFVLMCLAIYQGIAQRKEQFITRAIRKKYRIIDIILLKNGIGNCAGIVWGTCQGFQYCFHSCKSKLLQHTTAVIHKAAMRICRK